MTFDTTLEEGIREFEKKFTIVDWLTKESLIRPHLHAIYATDFLRSFAQQIKKAVEEEKGK